MSFNIEIESGTTARLLVGGKYCDRDIVVTATSDDLAKQIVERTIKKLANDQITKVNSYALSYSQLIEANLPNCTLVNRYGFYYCYELVTVDFANLLKIEDIAFGNCSKLTTLILRSVSMVVLTSTNAFSFTPIADGTGYIYVPAASIDTYKADSNWSVYANQIRAIEDYPDICGTETN